VILFASYMVLGASGLSSTCHNYSQQGTTYKHEQWSTKRGRQISRSSELYASVLGSDEEFNKNQSCPTCIDENNPRLAEIQSTIARTYSEEHPRYLLSSLRTLGKSATKDSARKSHAIVGSLSLISGMAHNFYLCNNGGWDAHISTTVIATQGLIHTVAALAGVSRIDFRNQQERARTTILAPAFGINAWLTYSSLTEWGAGAEAPFTMYGSPAQLFVISVLGVSVYQLTEVWRASSDQKQMKTGLWNSNPVVNVLLSFLSYQSILLLEAGLALGISLSVDHGTWETFALQHPKFINLIANLSVDTAFANNVSIFLGTLLKYKAMSNATCMYSLILLFNVAMSAVFIFPTAYAIDDGAAMDTFLSFLVGSIS